jgi:hypothetical protein
MKRLLNFFKNKNYWLKNGFAADANGHLLDLNMFTNDMKVYKLSLHGAIAYLFPYEKEPEKRSFVLNKLSKAISIYTKKSMFVAQFNDAKETSFEDVINVLKIADSIK